MDESGLRAALILADEGDPFGLRHHLNAKILGLFELRARTRSSDQNVGATGHGSGHFGSKGRRPRFRFVSRHRFERTGKDDRLARHRALAGGGLAIFDDELIQKLSHHILIVGFAGKRL